MAFCLQTYNRWVTACLKQMRLNVHSLSGRSVTMTQNRSEIKQKKKNMSFYTESCRREMSDGVVYRSWGWSVWIVVGRRSGPVHLTLLLIVMKGHVSASIQPLYNARLFPAPLLQKALMHSLWPRQCKSNIWPQISSSCTVVCVCVCVFEHFRSYVGLRQRICIKAQEKKQLAVFSAAQFENVCSALQICLQEVSFGLISILFSDIPQNTVTGQIWAQICTVKLNKGKIQRSHKADSHMWIFISVLLHMAAFTFNSKIWSETSFLLGYFSNVIRFYVRTVKNAALQSRRLDWCDIISRHDRGYITLHTGTLVASATELWQYESITAMISTFKPWVLRNKKKRLRNRKNSVKQSCNKSLICNVTFCN